MEKSVPDTTVFGPRVGIKLPGVGSVVRGLETDSVGFTRVVGLEADC
jgi:hypothetical protein